MPKIMIEANESDSGDGRVTLSARVVAAHLQGERCAARLIERIARAVPDAERLESPTDRPDAHGGLRPTRPPRETASSRPVARALGGYVTTNRPIAIRPALDRRRSLSAPDATGPARDERDDERAALWLYAWSYEALRPTGGLLAARLTTPAVLRPGKRVGHLSRRQCPEARITPPPRS